MSAGGVGLPKSWARALWHLHACKWQCADVARWLQQAIQPLPACKRNVHSPACPACHCCHLQGGGAEPLPPHKMSPHDIVRLRPSKGDASGPPLAEGVVSRVRDTAITVAGGEGLCGWMVPRVPCSIACGAAPLRLQVGCRSGAPNSSSTCQDRPLGHCHGAPLPAFCLHSLCQFESNPLMMSPLCCSGRGAGGGAGCAAAPRKDGQPGHLPAPARRPHGGWVPALAADVGKAWLHGSKQVTAGFVAASTAS